MKRNLRVVFSVLVLLVVSTTYGQKKGKKSTIAEGTIVTGNITAVSDFDIYGQLNGNFTSESTLIIGETAQVNGNVTAANVTVRGNYEGELTVSGLLSVEEQASLKGKANIGRLSVKEGAVFIVTTTMPERDSILTSDEAKKKKKKEDK